jgi:exodeoxyribonuclease VII large subunit
VRARVAGLTSHRVFEAERGRLRALAQRLDDLSYRSETALRRRAERSRERLQRGRERVEAFRLDRVLAERHERVARHHRQLTDLLRTGIAHRRGRLGGLAGKLDTLSPLSVLSRGYALVWDGGDRLVRDPSEVAEGDALRIRVAGGSLSAVVTGKGER